MVGVLASIFLALAAGQTPHTTWHQAVKEKKGEWKATAGYPQFHSGTAIGNLANREIKKWAVADVTGFALEWKDGIETSPGVSSYSHETKPTVSIAQPNLISVYFSTYEFTGGAHPNTFYNTLNFGVINGKNKKLVLKDLFVGGIDPVKVLDPIIMGALRENEASLVTSGEIKNLDQHMVQDWILTPNGITFLYGPYAVASYAEGIFFVKVTFEQLKGKLNPAGPLKPLLENHL